MRRARGGWGGAGWVWGAAPPKWPRGAGRQQHLLRGSPSPLLHDMRRPGPSPAGAWRCRRRRRAPGQLDARLPREPHEFEIPGVGPGLCGVVARLIVWAGWWGAQCARRRCAEVAVRPRAARGTRAGGKSADGTHLSCGRAADGMRLLWGPTPAALGLAAGCPHGDALGAMCSSAGQRGGCSRAGTVLPQRCVIAGMGSSEWLFVR